MKMKLPMFIGAAAIAAASFFTLAVGSGVEAQSDAKAPVILIVDRAQLVQNSKAGKTIPDQAQKVRDNVAGELEAEKAKLEKEIQDFQKNASLMSDEVRAQKEQELAVRSQVGLPQRVQIMDQAFTSVVQNAQAKILIESQPILKDILEKRGATILLDRAAVMYASPETDITQEVLAELDKKMKTVEVQKISLAEVEKQLAEAAKAQQEAAKKK